MKYEALKVPKVLKVLKLGIKTTFFKIKKYNFTYYLFVFIKIYIHLTN